MQAHTIYTNMCNLLRMWTCVWCDFNRITVAFKLNINYEGYQRKCYFFKATSEKKNDFIHINAEIFWQLPKKKCAPIFATHANAVRPRAHQIIPTYFLMNGCSEPMQRLRPLFPCKYRKVYAASILLVFAYTCRTFTKKYMCV